MAQGTKPPDKTFRAGRMSVALWRNVVEVEGKDEPSIQHSLRVQKRYLDEKTKEWTTADYLYPADLPKLIICAQKAFEFISLKEVDNNDSDELPRI